MKSTFIFSILPHYDLKKPNSAQLINHEGFSDQIRQWFNKCKVYNTSASGGVKKGQKKQFFKAWPIQGVLYLNRPTKRITIFLHTLLCSRLDKFTVFQNIEKSNTAQV